MKTYEKRSASILLAVILALQMMFVSGITVFAEGTETPIVPIDSSVNINGLNLVLSGEIGLTYHVYVPKKYRDGTMVLKCMDEEITMNITECPQDNDHRYTATYYLSAIELSEPVTLTVYAKDDTNHKNPLATKSRSAEDYVKLLLEDEKATDKEKNIAKTLINYGHYAQLACSEANGWVIGEDYAETTAYNAPTVDTSVFSDYGSKWNTRSGAVNHLSMSLCLDYKTSIMLYIPVEEQPTVKVNGEEIEAVLSERVKNTYQIEIPGINALNLTDEYTVEIDDVTITLCAFSYCKLAVSHNASQNTINAMRALYEFYQATVAYNTPAEVE